MTIQLRRMRKCEENINRLLLTEVSGYLYVPRDTSPYSSYSEQTRHRAPRIFGTTQTTSVFLTRVRFRDPFIII